MTNKLKITRAQLAAFLSDHQAIKQFENLFSNVTELTDDSLVEISIAAANADNKAQQALDLLQRVADLLDVLTYAPHDEFSTVVDVNVLQPGEKESSNDFSASLVQTSQDIDYLRSEQIHKGVDQDYLPPMDQPQVLSDADYTINGDLILSKTSGKGIKIDKVSPTFGWRDMLGAIETRPAAGGGATAIPDFVAYRGNIYDYRFGTVAPNDHLHEAFINYHIPHDYVPGTDLYLHVHWSQIVADTGGGGAIPGVAKWYFDFSYAKGHGTAGGVADPFPAPKTISVTQQGSTTQYGHMIAEVAFTNNGGDATHIDRNLIQVDGVIQVRIYRNPADVADTLNQDTFVHYVDIHYQSTNMATKQKAPNFYL